MLRTVLEDSLIYSRRALELEEIKDVEVEVFRDVRPKSRKGDLFWSVRFWRNHWNPIIKISTLNSVVGRSRCELNRMLERTRNKKDRK